MVIENDQHAEPARALREYCRGKARLSELEEKAASGEEIVIARDHKPVARLVPVGRGRGGPRTPESAKGQVWIAPDFGNTLSDFDDYTR